MTLPTKYIPSALRNEPVHPKPTQIIYACGYEPAPGSFGMWHGPAPDVMEMLETIPDEPENNPVIIKFLLDGSSEVIYCWNHNENCWVRTQEKPI